MRERPSAQQDEVSVSQTAASDEQAQTRQLLADVQALSSRITAVQEIVTAINQSLELDEILDVVSRQAKWLLDFDSCSVFLLGEDTSSPSINTLFGPPVNYDFFSWADQNPLAEAINTKQAQLVGTTSPESPYQSLIIVPLAVEGNAMGTINFGDKGPDAYTIEDLRIVYLLALQLASAIHNANQFKRIRSLYQELAEAYRNLASLEQMRDQLIHMIAHDLRNPISVMINTLDLINYLKNRDGNIENEQTLISRAMSSGRRSLEMIDDMLTVSKIESGGFNPVLEPVNILDLIIEQFPGYQLHAQRDDIALHLSIPDQLPLALADSSLIGRVLDNLVTNAIKYTKTKGEIRIEALQTDDWLEVRVQDDGQGIREEYQESIFNKFAQLPAGSNGSFRQGVGLGLTFCRLAIEAHNGRIWVKSSPNQGSTFHFTLPLAP